MRPFNAKEILDWWAEMKHKKEREEFELYISPLRVGSPECQEDVNKHSQEVNGVKIAGRVTNGS